MWVMPMHLRRSPPWSSSPKAMNPYRSSSLIAPVALEARRGEAQELVEETAACRVGSEFWHEFELRLARTFCCIMIPHARLIDIGSASQGALRMFVNAFDVAGPRAADRVEGREEGGRRAT